MLRLSVCSLGVAAARTGVVSLVLFSALFSGGTESVLFRKGCKRVGGGWHEGSAFESLFEKFLDRGDRRFLVSNHVFQLLHSLVEFYVRRLQSVHVYLELLDLLLSFLKLVKVKEWLD